MITNKPLESYTVYFLLSAEPILIGLDMILLHIPLLSGAQQGVWGKSVWLWVCQAE